MESRLNKQGMFTTRVNNANGDSLVALRRMIGCTSSFTKNEYEWWPRRMVHFWKCEGRRRRSQLTRRIKCDSGRLKFNAYIEFCMRSTVMRTKCKMRHE